jgi:hypothetical protein
MSLRQRISNIAGAALVVCLGFASVAEARGFKDLDLSGVCAGPRVNSYGDFVACTRAHDFQAVRQAKKAGAVRPPQFVSNRFSGAIELGLMPDADTNGIYHYVNALVEPNGKRVGYLVVDGYENSEMQVRAQLTATYNLKGDLISASWSSR